MGILSLSRWRHNRHEQDPDRLWIWRWLDDCRRDVRHAGRTLVRTPTFTLATVLLALVALGAAMVPAWRASSVSPTEALRAE